MLTSRWTTEDLHRHVTMNNKSNWFMTAVVTMVTAVLTPDSF